MFLCCFYFCLNTTRLYSLRIISLFTLIFCCLLILKMLSGMSITLFWRCFQVWASQILISLIPFCLDSTSTVLHAGERSNALGIISFLAGLYIMLLCVFQKTAIIVTVSCDQNVYRHSLMFLFTCKEKWKIVTGITFTQ